MIQAVIFDLDNTICNSSQVIKNAVRHSYQTFVNYFPNITEKQFLKANDEGVKNILNNPQIPVYSAEITIWYYIFEQLGLSASPLKIYKLYAHLIHEEIKHIVLFKGFKRVLKYLKSNRIKIGILSNGSFLEKVKKIEKIKIDSFVDYLVSTDLCLADKPSHIAFQYILNKLNVKPSETIYIGDQIDIDILPAQQLGFKTILFMPPYKKYKDKDIGMIKYKIGDYNKIFAIFNKLDIR